LDIDKNNMKYILVCGYPFHITNSISIGDVLEHFFNFKDKWKFIKTKDEMFIKYFSLNFEFKHPTIAYRKGMLYDLYQSEEIEKRINHFIVTFDSI